jgi:HAD superfamily hydrolase (TIGR01509 family)
MLRAILFDLDQTLIDWDHVEQPWEEYQYRRIHNVFEFVNENLYTLETPEQLFEAYVGEMSGAWQHGSLTLLAPDIMVIMADTLKVCGVPEDRLDMDAVMQAYDWQPPAGERAYPDAVEVLPQLRAHGIELGIVTNSAHPMHYRDRELQAIGLLDLFPRCRLSAVDVGYLKPHRDIFQRALDILGVRAEEAVFVGDSLPADIGGAQNVGIYAVQRLCERAQNEDSPSPRESDSEIVPDGTIVTLHDLLPLLDGWYPGWRNGHT